MYKIDLRY